MFKSLQAYSTASDGGEGSSSLTLYISPGLGFLMDASKVCAKSSTWIREKTIPVFSMRLARPCLTEISKFLPGP